jgi:hypothetical protein
LAPRITEAEAYGSDRLILDALRNSDAVDDETIDFITGADGIDIKVPYET